ncbi:GIY-YIG nuclease family protein [Chryseobacterium sp. PBS4-4]|uniref:GIY-YIG nuclease family protein n=1 Tax=Chryseobacterium edaphi TaxID=2976532 RepID=A0ABT2W8J8_9FLAO|nr:GIY-YIG nuclease family protein [Chryseobacterium edaphi]MCU7618535.1 GIY-YIG nuclease family protein [Chryseobacterium edaphi]
MEELKIINDEFNNGYFELNEELIHLLNQDDLNGSINNVLIGINQECFGIRLFEEEDIIIELFYITYKQKPEGDLIRINLNSKFYALILLRFCSILEMKYKLIKEIDTFNTFQKYLRTALEKDKHFTITNLELKEWMEEGKEGTIINTFYKSIKVIEMIPKVEFLRSIFNNNYNIFNAEHKSEYIYLMVNKETSLIKIGFSKQPIFREKTLQSKEPEIFRIACWKAQRSVETELHRKYKEKRLRGEYFKLNLKDLHEINRFMENYN